MIAMIVDMAPWPLEVVPKGTPTPAAARHKQRETAILAAAGDAEIELGGQQSVLGTTEVILLLSSIIGTAQLDLRQARLTLWRGPKQHPIVWGGVRWRWAASLPPAPKGDPILTTEAAPKADIVTQLVVFLSEKREKAPDAYTRARKRFGADFTKEQFRKARRLTPSEYKFARGERK
jgi:hypothetical protein